MSTARTPNLLFLGKQTVMHISYFVNFFLPKSLNEEISESVSINILMLISYSNHLNTEHLKFKHSQFQSLFMYRQSSVKKN